MEQTNKKSTLRIVKNTFDKQNNSEKALVEELAKMEVDMKNMLDKIVDETSKVCKYN